VDDLNDMLGKILNDPESMNQLKEAARALGLDPDGPPPPGFGGGAAAPDLSALGSIPGGQNQTSGQSPPLDPAALQLIGSVVGRLNQPDKNIDLLRALKPHFSPQRATRVDSAIRLMQLFSLLPLLKESGLLGDLKNLGNLGSRRGGGRRP
jgi:hypothetical protein